MIALTAAPARGQRAAALALFAAICGLIVLLVIVPAVAAWIDARDRIDAARAQLRDVEARAARLPLLAAERAALVTRLDHEGGFLRAPSAALSAAQLQAMIKDVVERHGGQLASTEILPQTDDQPFPRLTARVEMAADTDILRQTWYDLESAVPYLFIDDFEIDGRQSPAVGPGSPPLISLDIRFDVTVYTRSGGS